MKLEQLITDPRPQILRPNSSSLALLNLKISITDSLLCINSFILFTCFPTTAYAAKMDYTGEVKQSLKSGQIFGAVVMKSGKYCYQLRYSSHHALPADKQTRKSGWQSPQQSHSCGIISIPRRIHPQNSLQERQGEIYPLIT